MVLNIKIKIDLGDAFTSYDRLALSDRILEELAMEVQEKHKNVKIISIHGEIEKE